MHNVLIQDLAAMLLVGAIFGWIFKKVFKLPLILGYIFAGIFIRLPIPYTPMVLKPDAAHNLAEIGILLLLFSMGLHFGVRKIKTFGFATVFVGILQALCMCFTGKYVLKYFGLSSTQALFLGAAVATSATSVVIKTLEDFQLKSHRFAERLMGVLLVEDSVAIFILIWLTAVGTSKEESIPLLHIVPIFLGSILAWWFLGTIIVPRLIAMAHETGKEELLVILSIGLALGLAYVSSSLNFSPALGAFVMGSILSECRELRKIEVLIEPVKNIFALVFFVSVGLLFAPDVVFLNWKIISLLVVTVILGKIFYNFIFNLIAGQGIKDSLRMAGSMGQIGELSFVIAQVGKSFGIISEEYFSSIVAVAVITMLTTPFVLKLFLYFAEKSDTVIPKSFSSFIEDYSKSLFIFSLDKKISPIYKKLSFLKFVKFFTSFIQRYLRKHYLLVTSRNVTSMLDRLAPWDEYLVPVNISFGTEIVGKNLVELKLRERFNVNVVAIGRDMHAIISPKPSDVIMGGDTLLVYGNEGAISKLEQFSNQKVQNEKFATIDECMLGRIVLPKGHIFLGKSIVELGIRNSYNCLILAINRNNQRIKNPVSSFIFEEDDEVFIFGTKNSIDSLNTLN
ncbi:MAG: cation:proton antiporter [Bdellovibrionota bacterium]